MPRKFSICEHSKESWTYGSGFIFPKGSGWRTGRLVTIGGGVGEDQGGGLNR